MAKSGSRKSGTAPQTAQRPWWFWVAIIVLPLVMSEIMFYMAGRWLSMWVFPVIWLGFWAAIAYRAGWFSRRSKK